VRGENDGGENQRGKMSRKVSQVQLWMEKVWYTVV